MARKKQQSKKYRKIKKQREFVKYESEKNSCDHEWKHYNSPHRIYSFGSKRCIKCGLFIGGANFNKLKQLREG